MRHGAKLDGWDEYFRYDIWHDAFVRFGMGEDDGVARLLRRIDRRAQSLHARRVERGDRHVVLLGDSADIPKVYQHIQSFL